MIDSAFIDHGATRVVECWGTDVPKGKTDERFDPAKNPMPFDAKRMISGGFTRIVTLEQ